jgi:hypothetical protein
MVWQPSPHRHAALVGRPCQRCRQSADMDNELPPDADKTDPNLYQNLDFYGWLAANSSQQASAGEALSIMIRSRSLRLPPVRCAAWSAHSLRPCTRKRGRHRQRVK